MKKITHFSNYYIICSVICIGIAIANIGTLVYFMLLPWYISEEVRISLGYTSNWQLPQYHVTPDVWDSLWWLQMTQGARINQVKHLIVLKICMMSVSQRIYHIYHTLCKCRNRCRMPKMSGANSDLNWKLHVRLKNIYFSNHWTRVMCLIRITYIVLYHNLP